MSPFAPRKGVLSRSERRLSHDPKLLRTLRRSSEVRIHKGLNVKHGRSAMSATESRRNLEEVARIGAEIFDRHVRPVLRPGDDGKFVAIDIGTGDYEVDEDDYAAVARLRT